MAIGTKLSKISALSNDLALALAAPTGQVRIEAPIPGRSLVGIELPNRSPEFVSLRKNARIRCHEASQEQTRRGSRSGRFRKCPCRGYRQNAPRPHRWRHRLRQIRLHQCFYRFPALPDFTGRSQSHHGRPQTGRADQNNGIPHLLCPVIVDPAKVLSALKWATAEMDRRYKLFAEVGARNIDAYNELSGFQALPYIIIIIDELADIMLYAQVEVEDAITRIAQMARATGIHLVLATQRPSVDIITGLIKANIPTRIAFAVSSMIDSKVIIDQPGAEKLLGRETCCTFLRTRPNPPVFRGLLFPIKKFTPLIEFLKKQGIALITPKKSLLCRSVLKAGLVVPLFLPTVKTAILYSKTLSVLFSKPTTPRLPSCSAS